MSNNSSGKCDEFESAKATNPVCSHVKFEWKTKEGDSACKDIIQYQIQVATSTGDLRELSAIPGSYEAFRVYNTEL
jgi:hypothetical protein